jgi:hypothetical protein
MPILTKAQLEALNQASFPDQSTEAITPAILRTYNTATIDTLVDSLDTGSFVQDLTSLNTFTQSQEAKNSTLATYTGSNDTKWNTLGGQTGSFVTSGITGSSLVTASFSGNTLTFTKGDSSTFGVIIPDVSGSTLPAGTISGSSQITALGFVSSSVTGSSLVTGSVSGNTLTFTKGDATGFSLTVATGSSSNTGSLMVTGSVSGNVLTFTKGDATGFSLTVETGSGGGTIDTGSFATTGSNIFKGNQTITGSVFVSASDNGYEGGVVYNVANSVGPSGRTGFHINGRLSVNGPFSANTLDINSLFTDALYASTGGVGSKILVKNNLVFSPDPGATTNLIVSGNIAATGSLVAALSGGYAWVGDSSGYSAQVPTSSFGGSTDTGSLMTTGSVSGNVLTFTKGDATTFTLTVETGSGGGGSTFSNPSVESISGSLLLTANTFTSGSANLLHLSASAQNQANLVFKNNNTTGDTIISGSNNIFTNPAAVTTGYKRYISGANNLYLNNTNGINSQITQSATTVSGARPSMNNNIFNGTGNFAINQAVNSGTHTYSQNIIGGTGNTTINALGFTGSLNLLSNFNNNGTITINAASASVAEIATGLSGSGTVTLSGNGIFGGIMTITSPRTLLTTNTQQVLNNVLAGGAVTITNISSSAIVGANGNVAIGTMAYSNAGAAGLGLHTIAGNMNTNIGAMNLIASASAIQAAANISPTAVAVTNRMFSGSLGVGALIYNNNQSQGATNTYTITGSYGGTGSPAMLGNGIFGSVNTIFTNVEGRGGYVDFRSNLVGGHALILTGSNNLATTGSGGGYFGRFNANDGLRNGTGENIFFVGTGTSEANRKTGFLIDSGSNTFVEGSFNVSGSSVFTGSISIAPTFQAKFATGSNQQAGTAVLDGGNPGTVTVSNSLVSANSIIMVSKQTLTNAHMVGVSSKGAGTFTITSNGNGDGDTVGWFIINNS